MHSQSSWIRFCPVEFYLFGCFSIYFLQRLAQKIYGNPAALWASLFFVVSPLLLWVQVRVLTESLFICTALASLYYFYDVFDGESKWNFCLLVLYGGACALTRPEGILTLLLIAIAGIFVIRRKNWLPVLYAMPALAPWGLLAAWFLLHSGRYKYHSSGLSVMDPADCAFVFRLKAG